MKIEDSHKESGNDFKNEIDNLYKCVFALEKKLSNKSYFLAEEGYCYENTIEDLYNWFYTENPHLGNVSPVFLIMKGKSKKLISFIKSAMEKNKEK